MENRRFHRVTYSAAGDLMHHDITYRARVKNLSLRGAMISSDECIMIPIGETCTLSVCSKEVDPPIVLTAQIVHSFFSMVGVKFVAFAEGAENRVFDLLRSITSEPDQLEHEWKDVLAHREEEPKK